jgi:hypothetical protein
MRLQVLILLSVGVASCTSKSPTANEVVTTESSITTATDSLSEVAAQKQNNQVSAKDEEASKATLVLSINELRYVDKTTDSSREIPLGTTEDQMVSMINKLLNLKQPKIGINSECGVGPLKMATWSNGFTVMFKENKERKIWEFVGWSMGSGPAQTPNITTMANIGIGSTRAEMEEAYTIKTEKTSLGYEFSTVAGGLYGLFSGPGKDATITSLWSGTSCVFR